jgi:hypothetical protein
MTTATFVRPIGLYFSYLFFLCLIVWAFRKKQLTVVGILLICLLGHFIATGLWMHRNKQAIGYGTFATVQEINLYEYVGASIHAANHGENWGNVRDAFRVEANALPEAERYRYMKQRAFQIVAKHPISAFIVWSKGAASLFFQSSLAQILQFTGQRSSGTGIIYKYHSMQLSDFVRYLWHNELPMVLLLSVGAVSLCPFWGVVLMGIHPVFRNRPLAAGTLLGVILFLVVISSGPQTTERFRAPIIPFASLFAAIGINCTITLIRDAKRGKCSPLSRNFISLSE